ncbi:phosphohydrolase [Maritimibacter sp. 55A14]|uniref:HD domain-containing protein n=1 Tax=Maritimibacter sp. 55A14 TaxID=2174844 RepID=UPI000D61FD29|nr:HD domain-containing protein [Maritimibacter sp. 55A14]PWE28401.1 phosphohydrolase [Maritimibacter sp. 55A14]
MGPTTISDLAADARSFACAAHQGQIDKLGHAYGAHIIHVGESVAALGPEFEAVGYLHDVVEDCDVSLREIERRLGKRVRDGVDAMTRRAGEEYHSDYLPRLMADEIAVRVKYADSRHNYGKIHLLADAVERARRRAKYQAIFDALETRCPDLSS